MVLLSWISKSKHCHLMPAQDRTGRLVGPFSSPHDGAVEYDIYKFVGIHFLLSHWRIGHSKMSFWSLRDAYSIIFNLLSLLEGELYWYWIFMHYLGGGSNIYLYIYIIYILFSPLLGDMIQSNPNIQHSEIGKSPAKFPRSKSGGLCLIFFGTAFDKQEVSRCEALGWDPLL